MKGNLPNDINESKYKRKGRREGEGRVGGERKRERDYGCRDQNKIQ